MNEATAINAIRDSHPAELFSDAVRNGGPQSIPLEYSIDNMRVIDAVQRSMRSGVWNPFRAAFTPVPARPRRAIPRS